MNRVDKLVLKDRNILDHLLKCFDPRDVMDWVIQENVLAESEIQILESTVTRNGRVRKFLEFVKRRRDGLDKLLSIFHNANMDWICVPVNEKRRELIDRGEDYHLISKLDPAKISRKLTEKQCLEIGKCIGINWKSIAIDLGFSQAEMYNNEMQHAMNVEMQACDLLIKWTQRKVDEANFITLNPILEDACIELDEDRMIREFS